MDQNFKIQPASINYTESLSHVGFNRPLAVVVRLILQTRPPILSSQTIIVIVEDKTKTPYLTNSLTKKNRCKK